MSRIIILPLAFLCLGFCDCYASEDTSIEYMGQDLRSETPETSEQNIYSEISDIEYLSSILETEHDQNMILTLLNKMIAKFDAIIKMITDSNSAYEFLDAKGLDRIIITNIGTPHIPLQTKILILFKTLFDLAPTTTTNVMPARMIDKLLDIFENDDDLGLKARVVDILHIWLPENPRVQARVMKVTGLVPFYEQMLKLDLNSLYKLLDLLNKILQEHLDVRYKNKRASKWNADELKLYQKIGLIEHMSRKDNCRGLLEIFRNTWKSFTPNSDLTVPILDITQKIAPFCLKFFKSIPEAETFLEAILSYLKEENSREYLAQFNMNATVIESMITDYVTNIKAAKEVKDEF